MRTPDARGRRVSVRLGTARITCMARTWHVIKEWYDTKDEKLMEERGELYVTERNLSSAARAYHEENKEDHVRTRDAVEKAANDVIDAQVATHATVEDIARFLGVGMDGMDENHRKTHAKRDAIGGGKVSS